MKKILTLLLTTVLLGLTACTPTIENAVTSTQNQEISQTENTSQLPEIPVTKPTSDRAGNTISVPVEIEKILTLAPSITQIAQSMGFSEMILGIDDYSEGYLLEPIDNPKIFDMQNPDNETIMTLEPDIIFVTGMSMVEGVNPFQPIIDAGICVAEIPSSNSLESIKEDIKFIADCMGTPEKAEIIIDKMDSDIAEIKAIGDTITEKKTIMFEVSAMPYIYSFGSGTFLDEMITLIGAENVFHNEISWIPVSEESALAANPDVILTSIYYLDDPEGEILSRAGWEAVTAVKNKAVHRFDSDQTDIPNQFITEALYEMAKFVYPEQYAEVEYSE
ncbi:MAG: ABC transporter substrate-binding protein [Ruminococcus sp.]|jgi:iron complex transport system substrate-binding protein|nr:ABC transporter substrate-binding protein [Ruminococcus sp.]